MDNHAMNQHGLKIYFQLTMESVALGFLALVLLISGSTNVWAGGLYLPGYGSQAQPRAGAFVARADDPSALFHNPAGLARQRGTAIHLGFNVVDFSQTFTRDGSYETDPLGAHPWDGQAYAKVENDASPTLGIGSMAAIPLLSMTTDFGLNLPLTFAAGLLASHGYPFRDYSNGYVFEDPNTPPPPGRYDTLTQDAAAAAATIGVGYSISDQLHVGVTLAWGFADFKTRKHTWGIRNYEEAVAADGEVILDAKDNFIPGFGLGILYSPISHLEIGVNYRSASQIGAVGTVRSQLGAGVGVGGADSIVPDDEALCAPGGTVVAVKGCIDITLPQTATLGARWVFDDLEGERADIEFDVRWEDWSAGSDYTAVVDGQSQLLGRRLETVITRHGLRDSFSFRLGGAYNLPLSGALLNLRAGVAYDTAAAPVSFTKLDLDGFARTTVGLGLGLEVGRFQFDLGAGAIFEGDRTVASCNPTVGSPGCDGSGTDTPVADRNAPDPEQPLQGPSNQVQSPYNGGAYSQGYLLFSFGATTHF